MKYNTLNQIALLSVALLLLSACAEENKIESVKEEKKPAFLEPTKIEVKGAKIIDSKSSRMSLVHGITYLEGFLYVLLEQGEIYRFKLEQREPPIAELDLSFGDNGKLTLPDKIRFSARAGDELVIRTSREHFSLNVNGLSKIESFPSGAGFSFTDDSSLALTHSSGSSRSAGERSVVMLLSREAGDEMVAKPFIYGPEHGITNLEKSAITHDVILLAGGSPKTEGSGQRAELVAFSHQGDQLYRFGNNNPRASDGFAFAHDLETDGENIFILDSNLRDLLVVSNDGSAINKIDLHRWLQVGYSWFSDICFGPNGTMIFAVVNDDGEEDAESAKFYMIKKDRLLSASVEP